VTASEYPKSLFLPRGSLQRLIELLRGRGFRCTGPQVRDGAIVYETMDDCRQLPAGMEDRQGPGSYRLQDTGTPRWFAWANGPQALRPLLFAPRESLWKAARDEHGRLHFQAQLPEPEPVAVIGVRACDLAALDLQDKHFLGGPAPDPYYAARRRGLFLVAVNCSHPAATCFCASTGDGPQAERGFDLVLDELDDGFVAAAGSEAGAELLQQLTLAPAESAQLQAAAAQTSAAVRRQVRGLPSRNLRDDLFANLEHPRWEEVAGRCLACGNCTSVCPTCFCHRETEQPALDGSHSHHLREWDSCFTQGHSYIHGLTIRAETRQRYRQWLTHKLGFWHDQYGRSGCVGCGRCITWCPAGIDITEEASALCARKP
jgi:sulfhydrogenase subunit beta (sulfur reductase)